MHFYLYHHTVFLQKPSLWRYGFILHGIGFWNEGEARLDLFEK